jgi:hypothetical protein
MRLFASSAFGCAHHHIDAPGPAPRAYKPRMPNGDGHLSTVALGHLRRVGLDLIPVIETPDDQAHLSRGL